MKTELVLQSGKKVQYKEGFLTPRGIEIIVLTGLTKAEKLEFKKEISYERDVAEVFFGKTSTFLDLIFS